MADELMTIHVERAPFHAPSDPHFVWVIAEYRQDAIIEVASSLKTYASPSEAMLAGEHMLRTLTT